MPFKCTACNIIFKNVQGLHGHLASKKHLAQMKIAQFSSEDAFAKGAEAPCDLAFKKHLTKMKQQFGKKHLTKKHLTKMKIKQFSSDMASVLVS